MAFKEFNCPSCGAALELEYRFSQMIICDYCNQTTHLSGENIEAKGEKVKLVDYGSSFFIGATGTLFDQNFKILGRIRFEYPDGFWDEWLVKLENEPDKQFWLQEDEGEYVLFEKMDSLPENTSFPDLSIGQKVVWNDNEIFISEKNTAQIIGGEGELPHKVIPGEQADFVDGIIFSQGIPTSLEFLPGNDLAFYKSKQPVTLNDFNFTEKKSANGY